MEELIVPLLCLIGLAVGLAIDTLALRLTAEPGEVDLIGPPHDPAESMTPASVLATDAGALALPAVIGAGDRWRRPAVAIVTAGLFAVAALRYGQPEHLALATFYIAVLVLCAVTDLLDYRVPNIVTYPALIVALLAGVLMPDADPRSVLAGTAFAGGILLVPALVTGGKGLGMGDVKLAAFVGAAMGFTLTIPALLLMAVSGGAAALFLLTFRKRHRTDPIPYAPFISFGALIVLLAGGAAFHSLA